MRSPRGQEHTPTVDAEDDFILIHDQSGRRTEPLIRFASHREKTTEEAHRSSPSPAAVNQQAIENPIQGQAIGIVWAHVSDKQRYPYGDIHPIEFLRRHVSASRPNSEARWILSSSSINLCGFWPLAIATLYSSLDGSHTPRQARKRTRRSGNTACDF